MRNLDRAAWRIYARRNPVGDPAAPQYLLPPLEGRRIVREEIVPELLTSDRTAGPGWPRHTTTCAPPA